jgi:hypothetical protein
VRARLRKRVRAGFDSAGMEGVLGGSMVIIGAISILWPFR